MNKERLLGLLEEGWSWHQDHVCVRWPNWVVNNVSTGGMAKYMFFIACSIFYSVSNQFFNRPISSYPGGGVLSGKVGTEMCGPDRVLFRPLRFSNGPFLI